MTIADDFDELPPEIAGGPRHELLTLLLDTQVVLWWMAGEKERIGQRATEAITDGGNSIVISAVVIWEIAIKRRLKEAGHPR